MVVLLESAMVSTALLTVQYDMLVTVYTRTGSLSCFRERGVPILAVGGVNEDSRGEEMREAEADTIAEVSSEGRSGRVRWR